MWTFARVIKFSCVFPPCSVMVPLFLNPSGLIESYPSEGLWKLFSGHPQNLWWLLKRLRKR